MALHTQRALPQRQCMHGVPTRPVARNVRPRVSMQEAQPAPKEKSTYANQLDALKSMSKVVADTGEPALVKKYKPIDCTTNPSLVYKAMQVPEYSHFLQDAMALAGSGPRDVARPFAGVADALSVLLGTEMTTLVPGRVSTEVDAHLSYDAQAMYDKALKLLDLYSKRGVEPDRVYIKLASTWEGIEACRKLQKEGIATNMTLLFSFAQAAGCADAGAALISPFVGRIMDWYKAKEGRDFAPEEDPGVKSVQRIYKYYKANGFNTIVMAASFRNAGEIRELAGCDNITISPALLGELEASTEPLPRKLWPEMGGNTDEIITGMNKEQFSALHNPEQMAVDKLKQGIEGFEADQKKLEEQLARLVNN